MPSGKTGVTRDEAKSQCQASGFWLPEMFARPDFNTAQTAAAFGNLLELGEVITKILQILFRFWSQKILKKLNSFDSLKWLNLIKLVSY